MNLMRIPSIDRRGHLRQVLRVLYSAQIFCGAASAAPEARSRRKQELGDFVGRPTTRRFPPVILSGRYPADYFSLPRKTLHRQPCKAEIQEARRMKSEQSPQRCVLLKKISRVCVTPLGRLSVLKRRRNYFCEGRTQMMLGRIDVIPGNGRGACTKNSRATDLRDRSVSHLR